MAKKFNAYVHVYKDPASYESFEPGDEVPDWALDKVGEHTYTDSDEVDVRLTDPHLDPDDPETQFTTPTKLPPEAGGQVEEEEDDEEEVDYSDLKKDELVALADERGVDSSGTKAEIIERLQADDEADEEE